MEKLWAAVKGIVIKNNRILILVRQNGILDLPGGMLKIEKQLNPY